MIIVAHSALTVTLRTMRLWELATQEYAGYQLVLPVTISTTDPALKTALRLVETISSTAIHLKMRQALSAYRENAAPQPVIAIII